MEMTEVVVIRRSDGGERSDEDVLIERGVGLSGDGGVVSGRDILL